MKTCILCKINKSFDDFYKQKAAKDGYNPYCKSCAALKTQEYIDRNRYKKDKVNLENKVCYKCGEKQDILSFTKDKTKHDGFSTTCKKCNRVVSKKFRESNPNYSSEYNVEYYNKNREKIKYSTKIYASRNKEKVNTRHRNKLKNDFNYRLLCRLRARIRDCMIRTNNRKNSKTTELLGCSIKELKQHLESQFTEGMTWSNYGKDGWEIDHIRPCASFDFSKEKEQKECFHHTNLQPLWKLDNVVKGSNYNNKKYKYDSN